MMLHHLIDSRVAFRLLLAVPAIVMLGRYLAGGSGLGFMLQASGEWAARFLVLTLAVTPLRLLMKQAGLGPNWPMWLFKRRRDTGTAAFLYAALHLGTYIYRQSNINVILFDLPYTEYLLGWIAFAGMLALALTSNDQAVHWLGLWWKRLQRLVYLTALAVFLHWVSIRLDNTAAYLHFAPLALLEVFRLWYWFARPGQLRDHA